MKRPRTKARPAERLPMDDLARDLARQAAQSVTRPGATSPGRPLHPGSCKWMGGADAAGDCSRCGRKHGEPGCGWE